MDGQINLDIPEQEIQQEIVKEVDQAIQNIQKIEQIEEPEKEEAIIEMQKEKRPPVLKYIKEEIKDVHHKLGKLIGEYPEFRSKKFKILVSDDIIENCKVMIKCMKILNFAYLLADDNIKKYIKKRLKIIEGLESLELDLYDLSSDFHYGKFNLKLRIMDKVKNRLQDINSFVIFVSSIQPSGIKDKNVEKIAGVPFSRAEEEADEWVEEEWEQGEI